MANALVQQATAVWVNGAQTATIGSAAWPSNNTQNNLITVSVAITSSAALALDATDTTDGTNTYTLDAGVAITGAWQRRAAQYSCIHAGSGAKLQIVWNPAGTTSVFTWIKAAEWSGITTTSPTEGANTATGTSTGPTVDVTVTTGSLIIGTVCAENTTYTKGDNYEQLDERDSQATVGGAVEYDLAGASQAVNETLGASQGWCMVACGYKTADGGATTVSTGHLVGTDLPMVGAGPSTRLVVS